MKVTMDRVGRVVVPKSVREQLGLSANTEFDVLVEGTALRLVPRGKSERQIRIVRGWPVITAASGQTLTDEDVRGLRDADRR